MSAYPISWHEQCLKNAREHWAREREKLKNLQEAVKCAERRLAHYALQIDLAKSMGKESFDEDKFGKTKTL